MNDAAFSLPHRLRRNRRTAAIRGLVRETTLRAEQFIYPLFIKEGAGDEAIASMPGCSRLSLDSLVREAAAADFDFDADGYKDPTADFIDHVIYDGTKPNAYIDSLTIGLKGSQTVADGAVQN